MSFYKSATRGGVLIAAGIAFACGSALGELTNDRVYKFGDDPAENVDDVAQKLGSDNSGSIPEPTTLDSEGVGIDLNDLDVDGDPQYVNDPAPGTVGPSPGTDGKWAAEFDGDGDRAATNVIFNEPSNFANNNFPSLSGSDYPRDYSDISSHSMQLWVKPDSSAQDSSDRQDVMLDTNQHGIYLDPPGDAPDQEDSSDNDEWRWGYQYSGRDNSEASSAAVTFDEWSHVQHVAALDDPVFGKVDSKSALLVNGEAVAANDGGYDTATASSPGPPTMSFASDEALGDDASDNFFTGRLDEATVSLWGNNETGETDSDLTDGSNWGQLDLNTDNAWIRSQWDDMNVDPEGLIAQGDVLADGTLQGDGTGDPATDDVAAFIENFGFTRTVDGVVVGDWISRQQGDLNYDGVVDRDDWFLLREAVINTPGASIPEGLAIPEPATLALVGIGMTLLATRRSRGPRS